MSYVLLAIIIALVAYIIQQSKSSVSLNVENTKYNDKLKEFQQEIIDLQEELGEERDKNRSLLSQKKSSETRLGQISEHLIPFLKECPYDPKSMHFIGAPIDFIIFNFDDGSISFLEIKSGNSKPSKRQKTIKNIIKSGRVFYEEMRINEKGIKHRRVDNLENSTPIQESDDEQN